MSSGGGRRGDSGSTGASPTRSGRRLPDRPGPHVSLIRPVRHRAWRQGSRGGPWTNQQAAGRSGRSARGTRAYVGSGFSRISCGFRPDAGGERVGRATTEGHPCTARYLHAVPVAYVGSGFSRICCGFSRIGSDRHGHRQRRAPRHAPDALRQPAIGRRTPSHGLARGDRGRERGDCAGDLPQPGARRPVAGWAFGRGTTLELEWPDAAGCGRMTFRVSTMVNVDAIPRACASSGTRASAVRPPDSARTPSAWDSEPLVAGGSRRRIDRARRRQPHDAPAAADSFASGRLIRGVGRKLWPRPRFRPA
jgi:hypothetical protein